MLRVLALALILTGAVLRFASLGQENFSEAEIGLVEATAPAFRVGDLGYVMGVVPLSATALARHWASSEPALRVPGALAGVATLAVLWSLGRLLFDAETALYATMLLALSPVHVALSRQVAPPIWLALLATCAIWTLSLSIRQPYRVSIRWACAAAIVLTPSCGPGGFFVLLALTIVVVVLTGRDRARRRPLFGIVVLLATITVAFGIWVFAHPLPVVPSLSASLRASGAPVTSVLSGLATGQPDRPYSALLAAGFALIGTVLALRSGERAVVVAWVAAGVAGIVLIDWLGFGEFDATQVGFALPGYFLLVASGLRYGRQVVAQHAPGWMASASPVACIGLVLLIELPALGAQWHAPGPRWRDATAIVARNALPDDVIVVLRDQQVFKFYAPQLERQIQPLVPPGRVIGYFVHADRGWLVAPSQLRFYAGWAKVDAWRRQFKAIDLSPDDTTIVLYAGRAAYPDRLLDVAHFDLPAATLVRGRLLLDLLLQFGPLPPLLWKVDQIALSRESLNLRNPRLLEVVSYLVEHDHSDRAASLAYRLAVAEPDWPEAQRALGAFLPERAAAP